LVQAILNPHFVELSGQIKGSDNLFDIQSSNKIYNLDFKQKKFIFM